MSDAAQAVVSGESFPPKRIGPIRIDHELDCGGMGEILCGVHEQLGRRVAVKMALPDHPDQKFLRDSLLREARALAEVSHRNVVTIFDLGELSDGTPFAVLELLQGFSLDRIIDSQGGLPPQVMLRISAEILAGMGAFHRKGFVMVDIKPDNVMVVDGPLTGRPSRRGPWIKLIDLGAVRVARDPMAALTVRLDCAVGSAWYMAPEAVMGMTLDVRSDLYSFGVLMYEMCAGRVPFIADTGDEVLDLHLYARAPRLSSVCDWVAPGGNLENLVHYCLNKSPEDRPPSAAHVFKLLRAASKACAVTNRSPAVAPSPRIDDSPTIIFSR